MRNYLKFNILRILSFLQIPRILVQNPLYLNKLLNLLIKNGVLLELRHQLTLLPRTPLHLLVNPAPLLGLPDQLLNVIELTRGHLPLALGIPARGRFTIFF